MAHFPIKLLIFKSNMKIGLQKQKRAENENVEERLIKERDIKIADIQKNFENDAHVEAKITG